MDMTSSMMELDSENTNSVLPPQRGKKELQQAPEVVALDSDDEYTEAVVSKVTALNR